MELVRLPLLLLPNIFNWYTASLQCKFHLAYNRYLMYKLGIPIVNRQIIVHPAGLDTLDPQNPKNSHPSLHFTLLPVYSPPESSLTRGPQRLFCFLLAGLLMPRLQVAYIMRQRRPPGRSKNHVCPRCGKGYVFHKSLTRHQRYECGLAPRFRCPHCMFRSKQQSHIREHIKRKHQGEQVYIVDDPHGDDGLVDVQMGFLGSCDSGLFLLLKRLRDFVRQKSMW